MPTISHRGPMPISDNLGMGMALDMLWEYIHSWKSLNGDLVFSHQQEIYDLKFPKWFFEDLFQRSQFFSSLDNLKTRLPNHWCPVPLHSHGSMPSKKQSNIHRVHQTHVFAKLHKLIEYWLCLKFLLKLWKGRDWMEWQLYPNSCSFWRSFF